MLRDKVWSVNTRAATTAPHYPSPSQGTLQGGHGGGEGPSPAPCRGGKLRWLLTATPTPSQLLHLEGKTLPTILPMATPSRSKPENRNKCQSPSHPQDPEMVAMDGGGGGS